MISLAFWSFDLRLKKGTSDGKLQVLSCRPPLFASAPTNGPTSIESLSLCLMLLLFNLISTVAHSICLSPSIDLESDQSRNMRTKKHKSPKWRLVPRKN